ncbi:extracellular solute-binding protein [Paenibacillus sp. BC26]|uniref:extracellular solute-binding protein n=1 Tax=Paenibacillus sp. BC26 TaxID=1881032 RepID=UPI0008EF4449|nr:extracellular solute-binding protein [Paenibacillus sp. BC26]SFT07597.1 carbohydrate ABC transporter substrate-binding protein, CUT1 family [Paenibacillus sp. BC26]
MRKLVVLATVAALSISMLSSCSKNNNNEPSQAANTPANSATATNNKEETPAAAEPTKFSISMRTLNVPYVEQNPDINKDKYVLQLEKMTNTDLDIRLIPHNEYQDKMIQMFATNDIPDVVQGSGGISGQELGGAVQSGVFLPLNDLLKEHGQNLLKFLPQAAWDRLTDAKTGSIYGIPEVLSNPSRRATWIRTDLLEKAGKPIPKTVEETLDVLRAFKELGVEHPYMGRKNFKYADTFFGSYDVLGYLNQFKQFPDGKVKPTFFDDAAMKKAIQTYKTMYDEGLISKEFATIESADFKSIITSGKAGMWSMNANELPIWGTQLTTNVPGAKVALIPSPVGDDGKGGYAHYNPVTRSYFINVAAKDKAADIIKYFDWMVSEQAQEFFSYGIEGEDYKNDGGTITYTPPTDEEGTNKQRYLNYWLWMVQDTTYNKFIAELSEPGKQMVDAFDNLLTKEGRRGIEFDPRLEAFMNYPDLSPLSDQLPPLVLEHVLKMVYGKEPIDNYGKVLEEYLSKGGNEVIEEATTRFNSKENAFE